MWIVYAILNIRRIIAGTMKVYGNTRGLTRKISGLGYYYGLSLL
jgi:hypothetical protein